MSKLSRLITNNNKLKTKITSSLKQGGSISVKDDYLLVPSGNISINSETLNTPINSETQQKTITLIDDSIVKGGYHVLSTIEERDAILCCYRKQGMKVVVVGTDFSFKEYVLKSPNCDTNLWEEILVNVDIDESEVSLIEDYSELGTDIQSQMELNIVLKNLLLQLQQDVQDIEVPTKTSDLQNDGENGSEPFITALDIPAIPQQVKSDWNAVTGPAEILNKPSIPAPQVNSDWNSTTGKSEILNKPRIPESTVDLQNNGEDGINPFITALDIPEESLTTIQQPTLVGNVLTIKYIGENGTLQEQPVDLSNLATIDIRIDSATYNASTNIITLTDNVGTTFNIDLSEFSIITSTDANGITTLTQEGVTKLQISKAGQTGQYSDLLGKPNPVDISTKLDKPLAPNNVPTRVILADGTTKALSEVTQDLLNNIKTLNFQLIDGELIVQDGSELQVLLVDNELIIN